VAKISGIRNRSISEISAENIEMAHQRKRQWLKMKAGGQCMKMASEMAAK
jgi:hypothetical protein